MFTGGSFFIQCRPNDKGRRAVLKTADKAQASRMQKHAGIAPFSAVLFSVSLGGLLGLPVRSPWGFPQAR
jgi:hypothetical protein